MSSLNPAAMPDVFLSYSHNDREAVEQIAQKLMAANHTCWIDSGRLRAQENYNAAIDLAIDDAIVFIAFLSKTYMNKPYCIHEFDRAVDKQKSIMVVCLDDVSENTNRQCAYMFSFSAGYNILGFGSGLGGQNTVDTFAEGILGSVTMAQLRRYRASGSAEDFPPVCTPDYVMALLRRYHEKQYRQSGNYALDEIRSELFPAIRDSQIDVVYQDENREQVSLVQFYSDSRQATRHVLITGEGGMGKTVSLLKTCEYLLSRRINAIYVPLSKIDSQLTLEQYLERIVCGGNQSVWRILKLLMSAPCREHPNLVLLLDGFNEVSPGYMEPLLKREIATYIHHQSGTQIIMTSRWFDNSLMHCIQEDVTRLEMQPLDAGTINLYLSNLGLPQIADPRVLSVVRTPLMLTLYSDVEKHKNEYRHISGIELEDNPDTAGKILGNFFQTQLYRAAEEVNFDRAAHLVLLEYLLPELAYRMIENQSMHLSEEEVYSGIDDQEDECDRYRWYRRDRLRKVLSGRNRVKTGELLELAVSSLHFLCESEAGYEFLHQSFRDYFAAFHIANEIRALNQDPDRIEDMTPVLTSRIFPAEILDFVSDIVHEEKAMPCMDETGWHFPGKNSTAPSRESLAEPLLELWRDQEGQQAQNAVTNLVEVMKTGRQKNLAWCDFSRLDLRSCWLNRCRFTEWYEDRFYPSVFDGAWLNRGNFLTDGHEIPISAILSDGSRYLFTGDHTGTVKVYDLALKTWYDSFQPQADAVVDLAWNPEQKLLAILYDNSVYAYYFEEKRTAFAFANPYKSKHYRYIRFAEDAHIQVSFDMEPLLWCDALGNPLPSPLVWDVPARCARWNPGKQEFIRSNLLQLLSVLRWDEAAGRWKTHPAIAAAQPASSVPGRQELIAGNFLSLRSAVDVRDDRVRAITYSSDGSKVLIALRNHLLEYETEHYTLLHKKALPGNVNAMCYLEEGIAVAVGTDVVLLEPNFSENTVVRGSQTKWISEFYQSHDGDGFFLFSHNRELKKLDRQLRVQSIRQVSCKPQFHWIRDRITNRIEMAFLPWGSYPNGSRYDYQRDAMMPLGWLYEFTEDTVLLRRYAVHSQLRMVSDTPPHEMIVFQNYTGIWFFRSSFRSIRGDMSQPANLRFLAQNGGITDDYAE